MTPANGITVVLPPAGYLERVAAHVVATGKPAAP
jgi:hypothetical protein